MDRFVLIFLFCVSQFLGPTIIDSTDRAKLTQADDVEEALTEEDEEEEEPQMPAWMAVAL